MLFGMFAIIVIIAVFILAGNGAKKEAASKEIRVGLLLYRGDDTFISTLRSYIEEKAKEYERTEGIKVTLDILDAKSNQNTQNNQVDRLLELGCNALCVNIVDRFAASVVIDKAMAADVPVIFFNREPVEEDMNRWEKLYYVGPGPERGWNRQLCTFRRGKQSPGLPDPYRMVYPDIKRRGSSSGKNHRRHCQLGTQPGVCHDGTVAYRLSGPDRTGHLQ